MLLKEIYDGIDCDFSNPIIIVVIFIIIVIIIIIISGDFSNEALGIGHHSSLSHPEIPYLPFFSNQSSPLGG